ncbi:MAG TPA: hypothetical protein VEW03_14900, partial [Longimicrobiaceae bacterium]|nr:hypothetical protein [Longimicrobiaceae bacterium]
MRGYLRGPALLGVLAALAGCGGRETADSPQGGSSVQVNTARRDGGAATVAGGDTALAGGPAASADVGGAADPAGGRVSGPNAA